MLSSQNLLAFTPSGGKKRLAPPHPDFVYFVVAAVVGLFETRHHYVDQVAGS